MVVKVVAEAAPEAVLLRKGSVTEIVAHMPKKIKFYLGTTKSTAVIAKALIT